MKINKETFFNYYRNNIDKDKKLSQEEVDNLNIFIDLVENSEFEFSIKQWAYIFATTFHETGHSFKPVVEANWLSENWRKTHLRYYPYHGRGYVQITWKSNYQKFSKLLGLDLVNNPELTLDPKNAFFILTYGFKYGSFTGKKISDYITSIKTDYKNARRCINGTDKADLIASYAKLFEKCLS